MYLAIDGRRLIRAPHTIEIVPYESVNAFTADDRPTSRERRPYVVLNCTFGSNLSYQDVMGELDRLRANRGVHSITFEPRDGCQFLTINAKMERPRTTHVAYDNKGKIAYSAFTVSFIQVETVTYLYPIRFRFNGIVAVMNPYTWREPPAAGRIISVQGHIRDLGAGAGQTRIQLYNNDRAINYLSTPGDFLNVPPPDHSLQNAALGTDLDFAEGDRIHGIISTIPAGGMSRDALVTAWAWLHAP